MSLSDTQIDMVIDKASGALAEYCMEHGIHSTVTGVSGGLDSAVVVALSQKAAEIAATKGYKLQSLGLILPCHSDPNHTILAKKAITKFDAELIEIDLTAVFDKVEEAVLKPLADQLVEYHDEEPEARYRTAQGNVKARLRMSLGTYFVANMVNGLVLSTDNYSEYWMGFWTLHGDVGDFGMIQELWKGTELIQIARQLGVPEEIVDAAPDDGLGVLPGGDEAQLGAAYPEVDRILAGAIKQGIDLNGSLDQLEDIPGLTKTDQKILSRAIRNSFKRKNPINLSRKQLGL